jgi:flagella basal body P-ring formation protein FlgA
MRMDSSVRNPSQSRARKHGASSLLAWALVLTTAMPGAVATAAGAGDPVAVARNLVEQQLPRNAAPDTTVFVRAEPLDPRLRLAPCGQSPEARLESNAITRGRALVRVACRAPVAWSVFVPVSVESEASVRVLRANLPRGATISEDDAPPQRRRFSGLSENYVKSGDPLTGYRLRRPVAAGSVLARDALEPAPVVHRGAQVTVRAESAGFRIETSGKALADAAPGQRVRVQQVASLKVVEGVVDNAGIVRVGP